MEATELAITKQEAAELLQSNQQMAILLRGMADMLRMTHERMAALEQAVRQLEKVTPQQAAQLNRMIRVRALDLCEDYRIRGRQREVAAQIRKALRTATGARSTRETARCDYPAAAELIRTWDDYPTMKAIRAKGGRTSGPEKTEQAGE